jgi:AcrR family transcriptional regulator
MSAPAAAGFRRTSDRLRILAATASVLARDGYEETTVEAIADTAGASTASVLNDVGDRDTCAREALLAVFHQAHAAASVAYHQQDTWSESVREALRALLGFLAAEPDFVKACTLELRHGDPLIEECLVAGREAFTAFLTPGHDANRMIPLLTTEVISGGVLHLVTRHAVDDTIDELPEALPVLTTFVLGNYLSGEEIKDLLADHEGRSSQPR